MPKGSFSNATIASKATDHHDLAPDTKEVLERCDRLAEHSDEDDCLTRSFLSKALEDAMITVAGWMQQAGLETERDHAGNLIGSYRCGRVDAPLLVLGSHLDTVRDAGRYDGALGVLLAIAVAERAAKEPLPFDLDVIAFSDEEGLRFGAPFLGSKGLVGALEPGAFELCDGDGISLRQVLERWNDSPAGRQPNRYEGRRLLGYIEAHIEQGPVLEQEELSLGVLEAIAASSWMRLSLVGRAGHAGTTPMSLRRDPLPAAAEIVLEAERLALADGELVATVGRLQAKPGAGNVIASEVELSLDMRHPEVRRLEQAVESMLEACRRIADRRGLDFEAENLHFEAGVHASPELSKRLEQSAEKAGIKTRPLVVGAGHDALIMARHMPVSMLLLRCPGGLSHHPDEAVLAPDVDDTLRCLHGFVDSLAAELRSEQVDGAEEMHPDSTTPASADPHEHWTEAGG